MSSITLSSINAANGLTIGTGTVGLTVTGTGGIKGVSPINGGVSNVNANTTVTFTPTQLINGVIMRSNNPNSGGADYLPSSSDLWTAVGSKVSNVQCTIWANSTFGLNVLSGGQLYGATNNNGTNSFGNGNTLTLVSGRCYYIQIAVLSSSSYMAFVVGY